MKIRKICSNCKIKFFLKPKCPVCNTPVENKITQQKIDIHKEIDCEDILNNHEE